MYKICIQNGSEHLYPYKKDCKTWEPSNYSYPKNASREAQTKNNCPNKDWNLKGGRMNLSLEPSLEQMLQSRGYTVLEQIGEGQTRTAYKVLFRNGPVEKLRY